MKLAIMQPYFFPYLGYVALMHHADRFVLFDTPQYDRKGWMHRNRILKPGEGWQYFHAEVAKPEFRANIRDVRLREDAEWQAMIFRQLEHYRHFAPAYEETVTFLRAALDGPADTLVALNRATLSALQEHLGLNCPLEVFSEMSLTLGPVDHPGQWALRIAEALGADEYVNPPGGREIFQPAEFVRAGIKLTFLEHRLPPYAQGKRPFENGLSIIDVLMCNGRAETRRLVECYDVTTA
jgi:hypothetical protein